MDQFAQVDIPKSIRKLLEFLFEKINGQIVVGENPRFNIAADFDGEKDEHGTDLLTKIGDTVHKEYEIDKLSRKDWEEKQEKILELAKQTWEAKKRGETTVSNVKYPILSLAALHFSARCYPNIVKGSDVVKCDVIGSDVGGIKAAKGARVSQHMSYQILEQMDSWEEEMDQLLMNYSFVGCAFKKTYQNPVENKPVSELVFANDLVINYLASFDKARRMTHIIELYPNEIEERIRSGVFLEFDYETETAGRLEADGEDQSDTDLPHTFLEQHRWWDLDDDGYAEPYVMTVHEKSQKVVRILPRFEMEGIRLNAKQEILRIEPIQYFTRYLFMPAFDGNVYGMGFGALLFAPVNIVNTIFNQLLDAGTLANRQGGFIGPGIKLKQGGGHGVITFQQGEWKTVSFMGDDIRKQIFALPVKEPSNVLFQLLGLMLEAVKELASQSDILSGEHPKGNVPATTTLALIEQGLKVFSAVYKRVYKSLKGEYKKIRRLNQRHLTPEEYNNIIDYTQQVQDPETGQMVTQQVMVDPKDDYSERWMDIIPVSGSADVSDTQRTIKAQALLEMRGQGLNDDAINKRYLEALQVPDINELLPPEGAKPPVDPRIELEAKKLELEQMKIEIDARRQIAEEFEKESKAKLNEANAMKAMAEAEAAGEKPDLEAYKIESKMHSDNRKALMALVGQLEAARMQSEAAKESRNEVSKQKS